MRTTTRLLACWIVLTSIVVGRAPAEQMQPPTPFVMGYANRLRCVPGEEVVFHLSSSGKTVGMVIQRLGAKRVTVFFPNIGVH